MIAMDVARVVVLAAFGYASAVAVTHWAVRRKHLAPFGPWARFIRRISDPVLLPVERRIVRAGRNPQDATWWLLGIVVVGGLVTLSVAGWAVGAAYRAATLVGTGLSGTAILVIDSAYTVLMIALFARVVGSWFGIGAYTAWMRPAYFLTDWMLKPIRRFLPPAGMIDFSPLVAWVLLMVLRGLLTGFFV
jgi:YggT family protein